MDYTISVFPQETWNAAIYVENAVTPLTSAYSRHNSVIIAKSKATRKRPAGVKARQKPKRLAILPPGDNRSHNRNEVHEEVSTLYVLSRNNGAKVNFKLNVTARDEEMVVDTGPNVTVVPTEFDYECSPHATLQEFSQAPV